MKIFSSFLIFFFTILLSCSTNETEVDQIKNTSLDIQMIESYENASMKKEFTNIRNHFGI